MTGVYFDPYWRSELDGRTYVETAGKVIDEGADDDYVGAGTVADVVHGGEGYDDIYGLAWQEEIRLHDGRDIVVEVEHTYERPRPGFTRYDCDGSDYLYGDDASSVVTACRGDDKPTVDGLGGPTPGTGFTRNAEAFTCTA